MSRSSLNGTVGKCYRHIHLNDPISRHNNSLDCCSSAVHRSIMAGICGNSVDGAYSIALSSLYKDDEDGGDVMYGSLAAVLIVSEYQQYLYWFRR
jgi:hypothetical protein